MQTEVIYEVKGDVAYLTLACDEPGKPATLDLQVLDDLGERLAEIQSRIGVLRAVVVQSDSSRYFVVGANVNALETLNAETIVPWVQRGHAVFSQFESLPLPVIAKVGGYALGGGLELAMACDLIIATRDAKFGQPEAKLGFVAGWGGTHRLPRRVGVARAKELFFTGRIIEAEQAYAIGLIDFVGDRAQVNAQIALLLEGIRSCSPVAVSQMKKLVTQSLDITIEQSCAREALASAVCLATGDTRERVGAFLEERRQRRSR